MSARANEILKMLRPKRIIYPIIIGLTVATYLLWQNLSEDRYIPVSPGMGAYSWIDLNEDNIRDLNEYNLVGASGGNYDKITYRHILGAIDWTWYSTFWILISIFMMVIRDFAYMVRLRVLTDNQISWRHSFDVVLLWEFASAVSPSVVGGSAVALFIVNKEGINMGKSTSVVLVTTLLDELFFILMVPLLLIFVGSVNLFPIELQSTVIQGSKGLFVAAYAIIVTYSLIVSYGVFVHPRGFKWLLIRIFSLPVLRKWRQNANIIGNEIIITSDELRGKTLGFWFKASLATFLSWTARYWVVNFIILSFIFTDQHFLIYARQLIMWVFLLVSPTPGGSGVAEVAFSGFLGEFIPIGLAGTLALVWRLISYYPYLFIGAIILPGWLRRVFLLSEEPIEED